MCVEILLADRKWRGEQDPYISAGKRRKNKAHGGIRGCAQVEIHSAPVGAKAEFSSIPASARRGHTYVAGSGGGVNGGETCGTVEDAAGAYSDACRGR